MENRNNNIVRCDRILDLNNPDMVNKHIKFLVEEIKKVDVNEKIIKLREK